MNGSSLARRFALSKNRLQITLGVIAIVFIVIAFWVGGNKSPITETDLSDQPINGTVLGIDPAEKIVFISAIQGEGDESKKIEYDILTDQNTEIIELVKNYNQDNPDPYMEVPVEFQYLKPGMSVSITLAASADQDEEQRAETIKIVDALAAGAKGSEGVSVNEGYFTVSSTPGNLILDKNNTYKAEVKLTVIPVGDFNAAVSFKAADVLKDGVSVKRLDILKVKVSPSSLVSAKYGEGVTMSVVSNGNAAKGQYIITYSAESKNMDKNYILPVSIE